MITFRNILKQLEPADVHVVGFKPEGSPIVGVPPKAPDPDTLKKLARKSAVVRLRKRYPDLSDLTDVQLLNGVHRLMVEDGLMSPDTTVDDLVGWFGR
ncbi:MAG TPA: hypothetical protein VGK89_01145 [Candidatus Eisenbacteria bacterium]|jgi:hypothetical protein